MSQQPESFTLQQNYERAHQSQLIANTAYVELHSFAKQLIQEMKEDKAEIAALRNEIIKLKKTPSKSEEKK